MASRTSNKLAIEVYSPSQGTVLIPSRVPEALGPYVELMRLHKPVGFCNVGFPYLLGCLLAACLNKPTPSYSQVMKASIEMLAVGIVLRCLGCAWNDIIDRDLDKRTERCKDRPLARKAISLQQAYGFVAVLLLCWMLILYKTATASAMLYAVPVPIMTAIYPYTKRFTSLAQLALGITLASGVFIGAAQLELDIIVALQHATQRSEAYSLLSLFAAYVCFSLFHDTLYAFQDIRDDKVNGAQSTAILAENHTIFFFCSLTLFQITTLIQVGWFSDFGRWYYITTVGGVSVLYGLAIVNFDIDEPRRCFLWFKITSVGFCIFVTLGLILQYTHLTDGHVVELSDVGLRPFLPGQIATGMS